MANCGYTGEPQYTASIPLEYGWVAVLAAIVAALGGLVTTIDFHPVDGGSAIALTVIWPRGMK
jgi:hypothetical protein